MHKTLTLCLIGCFLWTACADHNGSLVATTNGPEAPINNPDDSLFPGDESGNLNKSPGNGGENEGSGNSGGSGTGSAGGSTGSGSAGDPPGGNGGSGGGAAGGGGQGSGGAGMEGGGQPVPEPSTLLLVGTGLAGAALLRRRRKTPE